LLTFFRVIEWRLFDIFARSIRDGIHVDDVVAVFFIAYCFTKALTVLQNVTALGIGEKPVTLAAGCA